MHKDKIEQVKIFKEGHFCMRVKKNIIILLLKKRNINIKKLLISVRGDTDSKKIDKSFIKKTTNRGYKLGVTVKVKIK